MKGAEQKNSVIFYGKPGCRTNKRQLRMLRQAGVDTDIRDLLSHAWTPEELRPFVQHLPVAEWFNKAAPAVKSGEVDPHDFPAVKALELLCETPLLIRRPLI